MHKHFRSFEEKLGPWEATFTQNDINKRPDEQLGYAGTQNVSSGGFYVLP